MYIHIINTKKLKTYEIAVCASAHLLANAHNAQRRNLEVEFIVTI
jgi:hypothetical protein